MRREVLGDEHVDRAPPPPPSSPPVAGLHHRAAWGEVWSRPGLDRRTRSMLTLALLTALRAENELAMHVRAAVRIGLTPEEIREVLLHTAVYAGVPAANTAFAHRPPAGRARTAWSATSVGGSDFVQSLERGLAVIRAFDRDHRELTLSEVAAATGVTRAAARRFLLTLVQLGYVRSDGQFFSLTPRVMELGYAYLSSLCLPEVAEPHLKALVAELNESSSVSVLDGTTSSTSPGSRCPAS